MDQFDVDYYVEKRKKGVRFTEIRKELEDSGFSQDEIKRFIREIDNAELAQATSSNKQIPKLFMYAGIVLMVIGLALVYIIKSEDYIYYAPSILGVSMYVYGRITLKR